MYLRPVQPDGQLWPVLAAALLLPQRCTETTNRDMPAKARQHSTHRQQQMRECPVVHHIQVGHAGARRSSPCPHGVNALRLDPSSRIPAASSTATARVSEPSPSINAPHMCSCCCAVSPVGVHCCMRWTIGLKCEASGGRRFLRFLDHTQASSHASQPHHC